MSIMKRTLWENNPNFVKNLPIIYSNFIIIMVTASGGKKTGGFTFVLTFVPSTNCDRITDSAYSKHTIILFVQSAPIS